MNEQNLNKHREKMQQVLIELLYIKCENCNKYVNKTRAINTEIVNYDFTFCGEKCYHDYSYRFKKIHKDIYGF
jgi:ribosomal protein S26